MTNLDNILKSRDITLLTKVRLVKAMVFPVVMYGCKSFTIKLSTDKLMPFNCSVGKDAWESLGLQGDPTSPSWRKSVLNIHWKDWGRCWNSNTLAPDVKKILIGEDWRQEEKGMPENEIVGCHHQLDEHEFEQALGIGDDQGSLACYSHGVTKSWTWLSDWTEPYIIGPQPFCTWDQFHLRQFFNGPVVGGCFWDDSNILYLLCTLSRLLLYCGI